ncbi:MAG: hypothetical protein WDN00_19395 [Limisphaerales bacterium]
MKTTKSKPVEDDEDEDGEDTPSIHKRNARKQKSREVTLPARFTPRFWEDSDNRISVVKLIRQRHELLKAHAGGHESAQRDLLCQRCAFVSVILETKEVEAAEGGAMDLGSYVQAVNCLTGLLRALGLEKRLKSVGGDLSAYLDEKEKQKK